jgi:2-methoxy-6-polyprenyl-1,4-benzoquinol methylase
MQHLDVAGGTGDVAFRVLRAIQTAEQLERQQQQAWQPPPSPLPQQQQQQQQQPGQPQQQQQGAVTVFDINAEMLEVGKQRAQAQGEQQQHPFLPAYVPA